MAKISICILIITLYSCGKDSSVEQFGAPIDQNQAGIISRCLDREEVLDLAIKHKGKFRELNKEKKYYEIYGIKESIIQNEYKKAILLKNKVISFVKSKSNAAINEFEEYAGAKEREEFDPTSLQFFPHLKQIGKDQVQNSNWGEGVVIAILDTGVSYNHPHLSANILTNPQDLHGTKSDGIDNDNNNYIDDYVGFDFFNHDPYPLDDHGHGETHVAGLVAGTISGVAVKAKILPVKVLSETGSGDIATIVAGVLYAIDRGADILNLSLGGEGDPLAPELSELVKSLNIASENGILIMAAAGNGGADGQGDCNDEAPIYPANIDAPTLLSIAAVDNNGELTSYSNFGANTVDFAAPGGTPDLGLRSTGLWIENESSAVEYVFMSGTSMATPIASGVAAVIISDNRALSASEIAEEIIKRGQYSQSLEGKVVNPIYVGL